LGERFAGEAVFGGAEPHRAPVVSAAAIETTGVFTQIRDQVQLLAAGNGSAVLANTKLVAQNNDPTVSPFRGFAADAARGEQADARRSVPVGDGIAISIGAFAYRNSVSVSDGQTTGSWSRDLIWGLSVIANLQPPNENTREDYRILVEGAVDALRSASHALIEDQAGLGVEQSRLTRAAERNENLVIQLEAQMSKIETVDLSEAITQLTSSRTLLEASYRAMMTLGDLSLARFMR
jgi:flagellin-like hook-associated protein FlgL